MPTVSEYGCARVHLQSSVRTHPALFGAGARTTPLGAVLGCGVRDRLFGVDRRGGGRTRLMRRWVMTAALVGRMVAVFAVSAVASAMSVVVAASAMVVTAVVVPTAVVSVMGHMRSSGRVCRYI